jgi:hypothetical protein
MFLDKRINDIEKELEQIYNQRAKGAQITSREKLVELGENNNSYFWGLEEQRQVKKSASLLNFDLLLQYIIVASLISIFRTSNKQSTLWFTLS